MKTERKFSDYKSEAEAWITLATGEYYPDILPDAAVSKILPMVARVFGVRFVVRALTQTVV